MTQTQVAYWNYKENQRHNKTSEAEDQRSHLADEAERAMHNRETERETHRHYLATETETARADQANEYIKTEQLNETIRSNIANEGIATQRNAETERSNRANEKINSARSAEERRHNIRTENTELKKANETMRHNQRVEEYQSKDNIWSNIISALDTLSGSKVLSDMLKQSQSAPGLTQEQKDRLAAETEYWKARTEAERSRTSNPQKTKWTPVTVLSTYQKILRDIVGAGTIADDVEQYLGGQTWQ